MWSPGRRFAHRCKRVLQVGADIGVGVVERGCPVHPGRRGDRGLQALTSRDDHVGTESQLCVDPRLLVPRGCEDREVDGEREEQGYGTSPRFTTAARRVALASR